jgi:hypothetical protein
MPRYKRSSGSNDKQMQMAAEDSVTAEANKKLHLV